MKSEEIKRRVRELAAEYNDSKYFQDDPVSFPAHFASLMKECRATLQDVEIAAVLSAHLAWGRREMIVRDCCRMMDEMNWKPFEYVMNGKYRNDKASLHRTIRWSEFAEICSNLKILYSERDTLEGLTPDEFRTKVYGRKADKKAANKKIWMLHRWMVRDDGKVDLGLWKSISPASLIIPLDVHVHRNALEMEITKRKSRDIVTAAEITEYLSEVFPGDPCMGDFALFAWSASGKK